MLDFVKSLFMDDKGGIKILPIALAAAGAFLLPMIPMIGGLGIAGNILGAVAGLGIGAVASGAMGGGAQEEQSPPQAPAGASPRPASGAGMRVEVPRVPSIGGRPAPAMG